MKREPARIPVADEVTERAIDEVRRSTVELCRDPFLSGRDIEVTLVDGVALEVQHGLGRRLTNCMAGVVRGATATGRIVETSRVPERSITLKATGHGATITVTLRVW